MGTKITQTGKVQRLSSTVQKYGWGRLGSDSAVAKLHAANSGAHVDPSQPYAEFWMGTHGSGPSFVTGNETEITLKAWIENNPFVLGDRLLQKWGSHLPFLFKVLSIAKPLSIQAHPNKALAGELHKLHPNIYKDDNHKPEMALAMTEFEALCGFLELKELKETLRNYPEITDLVGPEYGDQIFNVGDDEEKIKSAVKSLFSEIMVVPQERLSEVLSSLKARLIAKDKLTSKDRLLLRLEQMYPNDVGVFAAMMMNYVKLNPGEALVLGPDQLHAYVSGDCVECMATSDNVVRAGLTPKERDVNTLCSMLTYSLGAPEMLKGIPLNEYTTRYRPKHEEFEVDRCILVDEKASVSFPALWGASILVVVDGNGEISVNEDAKGGEAIVEGDVLFVPANTELKMHSTSSRLELYRAGVNTATNL